MYRLFIPIGIVFSSLASGQAMPKCAGLPYIPHPARVQLGEKILHQTLSIEALFQHGLKVVLDDSSFKVIGFAISFDCHSRALTDFDFRAYAGDHVSPDDQYFRRRIRVGDVIIITCVNITKGGMTYVMKEAPFMIVE